MRWKNNKSTNCAKASKPDRRFIMFVAKTSIAVEYTGSSLNCLELTCALMVASAPTARYKCWRVKPSSSIESQNLSSSSAEIVSSSSGSDTFFDNSASKILPTEKCSSHIFSLLWPTSVAVHSELFVCFPFKFTRDLPNKIKVLPQCSNYILKQGYA